MKEKIKNANYATVITTSNIFDCVSNKRNVNIKSYIGRYTDNLITLESHKTDKNVGKTDKIIQHTITHSKRLCDNIKSILFGLWIFFLNPINSLFRDTSDHVKRNVL